MVKISRYLGLEHFFCQDSVMGPTSKVTFILCLSLSDTRSEKIYRSTFYTTDQTLCSVSIKNHIHSRAQAHTKSSSAGLLESQNIIFSHDHINGQSFSSFYRKITHLRIYLAVLMF
jgi:hypothetical protein